MPTVKLIRKSERQFTPYAGDPAKPAEGVAHIARMVGPELSRTMGVGVAKFSADAVFYLLAIFLWERRRAREENA